MFEVIAAAASTSPRGEDGNEDRVRSFLTSDGGAGVVLCDGVGAVDGSAAVAEMASRLAAEHFAAAGIREGSWGLERLLADSVHAEAGASTLIACGADSSGLVSHALVGNGSLLEVEPVVFDDRVRLRWADIVLPQIDWIEGRPALRSFLPANGMPLELARGWRLTPPGASRAYLACTDGIASDEERAQGTASGRVWKEVPTGLVRLLEQLAEIWEEVSEGDPEEARGKLEAALVAALSDLLNAGRLDDDASVGVVLLSSRQAGGDDE